MASKFVVLSGGKLTLQGLTADEVASTTVTTTTSPTAAVMSSMTLSPSAGTYLVWFSCELSTANAGAVATLSFFVAGVQKASTIRKVMPYDGGTGSSSPQRTSISINTLITLTGSQTIDVRWSTSSGTMTAAARAITYLKII